MKDNIERRTIYGVVEHDGNFDRKKSKKKAKRSAEAKQRLAEDLDSCDEPRAVVRCRQEVDLEDDWRHRHWGTKKKVVLFPEEFPQGVEKMREEHENLEETWSDRDVSTTDYFVENEDGEEIPIDEYERGDE